MLCLNYLNKTVELLFILYNFAIVPSVGTGIKTLWAMYKEMRFYRATKKLTYGAEEAPKTGRIFTMRHPVVKKK